MSSRTTAQSSLNLCPVRLSVRTSGFQPGKRSSILLRDAKYYAVICKRAKQRGFQPRTSVSQVRILLAVPNTHRSCHDGYLCLVSSMYTPFIMRTVEWVRIPLLTTKLCSVRLSVRSAVSHIAERGSIPLRSTKQIHS